MYAIYGTWYRIHAHKVTQPYGRLVHSSIYSFYVIHLFMAALLIILDIVRGVSHLSHRGIEYYKICAPTSDISVLPETIQQVPRIVLK